MAEERWQLAIERITSDPALTGELTDQEAILLLRWAEGEVVALVNATAELPEEAAWEQLAPQLRALRHKMRRLAKVSAAQPDPLVALQNLLGDSDKYPLCVISKRSYCQDADKR
ncbi:MAG: hypothetical protein K8R89_07555 [Anaerolineae bacterium]|nr:hypothetical protein [Anaerolineae bacterium]